MSDLWFSKSEVAELLGREEAFVRDQVLPRLAADEKKKLSARGSPWRINGPAAVRAYTEWLAEAATGDPAGYSAANSPALERQREARARLLEWELAERRGQLFSREIVQDAFSKLCGVWRGFGEEEIKQHGNGTLDRYMEAVEASHRAMQDVVGDAGDRSGEDVLPGPADHVPSATAAEPR